MEINRADIPAQAGCDIFHDHAGRVVAVIIDGTRYSPAAIAALAARVAELEGELVALRRVEAEARRHRAHIRAYDAWHDDPRRSPEDGPPIVEEIDAALGALWGALDAYAAQGGGYAAERAAAGEVG